MKEELDKIVSKTVQVTVKNETFTISTFTLRGMGRAYTPLTILLAPVYEAIRSGKGPLGLSAVVFSLHREVAEVISVATGKTTDWALDLDLDDSIRLMEAVVEVNLDFFMKVVLPLLNQTWESHLNHKEDESQQ